MRRRSLSTSTTQTSRATRPSASIATCWRTTATSSSCSAGCMVDGQQRKQGLAAKAGTTAVICVEHDEIASDLHAVQVESEIVPPLEVVRVDRKLWCLSNRRLTDWKCLQATQQDRTVWAKCVLRYPDRKFHSARTSITKAPQSRRHHKWNQSSGEGP